MRRALRPARVLPAPALLSLALLSLALPASAAGLRSTWIDPEALALERVLPPPPAPGSPEAEADRAAVRKAVAARTPADEARITADLPCTLDRFADVLGPAYTAARMPRLAALIEAAFQDGELAVLAAKRAVGRPRPYTLEPDLPTYGRRSGSASYPSGHATFAHLAATLLAWIVPGKRDALFARAGRYAHAREEAGTHFPSDIAAGRIAAAVVAESLWRDPAFRRAFEAAAAEARQADGP